MKAQEYFDSHGITEQTLKDFNIAYDEKYIHLPIKDDDGKELFTKQRYLGFNDQSTEPKYKNSQGSKITLFNYDRVKDLDIVIITEGEFDAIRLQQEGIPAVSSTGGAATFPKEYAEKLKDKEVWIAYDNDEPGKAGATSLLELIPHARVVQYPENIKDACDFFNEYNQDDFLKLMKLALTSYEWKAQYIPDEHTFYDGKTITEMQVPKIPWLIKPLIYQEGFCFLYGAEGIGKSFVALSIGKAIAEQSKWLNVFDVENKANVLYLDKENPLSLTVRRVQNFGGVPENMYWLKCPEKFRLHDGKGGLSEFAIDTATLVKQKNIGLIIIDSFIDLVVGNESSSTDTQLFFEALRQLYPNVAFLVLHHENKPSQGVQRNSSQRLRGSSNINAQTFTMFRIEARHGSKNEFTLEQTKARDEQKMDKFLLEREVVRDPESEGTIVSGLNYLGIVSNKVDIDDSKSEEAETQIMTILQNSEGASRQNIMDALTAGGISRATVDRTLKEMEDAETIRKYKKGRQVWFADNSPIVSGELMGTIFEQ